MLWLFLFICQSVMLAQNNKVVKDVWRKIGETQIDFKKETGEILITDEKRYGSVKIRVSNATINLESFDIYFDNGEMQRVDIHQLVKSDSETNAVNLNGKKTVKRIDLRYKSIGVISDVKPRVELWGI